MKKWNVLVTGNDGRKFYQNFHVIEASADAARKYFQENFNQVPGKAAFTIEQIEEMEEARYYLPGIVYRSGKAYFA